MSDEMRCFTNGTDTVSARDEADALAVLREVYGDDDAPTSPVRAVPDDKEFRVYLADVDILYGKECPSCGPATATSPNGHQRGCPIGHPAKTAATWARETGRGLVASSEW